MKIGIMQPYFVPYLGYWQLINVVDKFVLLDNVKFVKQGYINRNSILSGGNPLVINILVKGISSNKQILNHELTNDNIWKKKLLRTIKQNYSKAPFISDVYPILAKIILYEETNISLFLFNQILVICSYLGINTEIIASATIYNVEHLKGEERILEICKRNNATSYINAIGGKKLYSKSRFKEEGIELKFINTRNMEYTQFRSDFISNLSIIDVMMFNSPEEISSMLNNYELV